MGEHVLAVDDQVENLLIIEEFLADTSYRLTSFSEPAVALERIREGLAPDAILLDRMMPGMSGIDFIRAFRRTRADRDVPIVMQTAAAHETQVAEGLTEGVFHYLIKPFRRELLQAVLRNALAHGAALRELQESLRKSGSVVSRLRSCRFEFRDLADVESIAAFLARAYPSPADALIGIRELMINAVEHGNLAISYETKSRLLATGGLRAEIERRLGQEPYARRVAEATLTRGADAIELEIRDGGDGFDAAPYLRFDAARITASHGRGIAMSRMLSFDDLRYAAPGNCVVAVKRLPA